MVQKKHYTKQELEKKIRNYGILNKTGRIIGVLGLITMFHGPTANIVESRSHPIEPPVIVRTYNDAQATLNNLREDKNKLEKIIRRYPYTPQIIEEITDIKEIKKDISKYDNGIKSIENDISKIEEDSDFIKYRNDVRLRVEKQEKRMNFFYLGFLGFATGGIGAFTGLIKKDRYQLELAINTGDN